VHNYASARNSQASPIVSPNATLPIGRPSVSTLLEARNGFGVYQRHLMPEGEIAYIIARLPARNDWHEYHPSSVSAPFASETEARTALSKWASAPLPQPLPKKPQARRKGTRDRQDSGNGADQLELSL
jgi:hypothetical protein